MKSKRDFVIGLVLLVASLFEVIFFDPQARLKEGPLDFEGLIQMYGYSIYIFVALFVSGITLVVRGLFGGRVGRWEF